MARLRPLRACLFALSFAGLAAACSGKEAPPGDEPDDMMDEGEFLEVETGAFEVRTGDVFECFYTDTITDRELAVRGATGIQAGAGGHHITVYYSTTHREPQHHPCQES
jgi:hypothetical protein